MGSTVVQFPLSAGYPSNSEGIPEFIVPVDRYRYLSCLRNKVRDVGTLAVSPGCVYEAMVAYPHFLRSRTS